jgi:hypothetical protein
VIAAGGGGVAGVSTGRGSVSGGAELLGALRADEPTDSDTLEPVMAVLRRWRRRRRF